MTDFELAKQIANKVSECGGITYFVGGFVRDKLLGIDNKDIDIEVHCIQPFLLQSILSDFGEVVEQGKSFGIYRIKGYGLDISLPRTERRVGNKHTSFEVDVDPFIGAYEASKRRDFTINALMQNVLTEDIVDFWNGVDDLNNKIIRHVDEERFKEDALRVLRACRFAAKLRFTIHESTINLCKGLNLSHLSSERVFGETSNALMNSGRPSIYFEQLRKMKQLDYWFPELEKCIDVPQNTKYHQEGDVWEHTMMVIDVATRFLDEVKHPLFFMYSALCHDFGKPLCTTVDDSGNFHSYGHELKGIKPAKRFIHRLTNEKKLREYVTNMVELHQRPNRAADANSSIKSTNHMFDESICPEDLITLSHCDNLGRIPYSYTNTHFLQDRLETYYEYMSRPFVQGRDLVEAGLKPGKNFTALLEYAHKMRLAGVSKENALRQTLAMSRKMK